MKACWKCSAEVEDVAKKCPSCHADLSKFHDPKSGYRAKSGGFGRAIVITVVAIAMLFAMLVAIAELSMTPEQRKKRDAELALKAEQRKAREVAEAVTARAEADRERAAEAAEETAKATEEAEKRKSGFHCLSGWDGSHSAIVDALKESLRDPDSFKHVETRITPTDAKGNHMLMMKYRAKNGFGGMNVGQLAAIVKDSDCSFEIVANASE